MENIATKSQQETGYEMDAELKNIMGSRYEDWSDKFTPEAQQERRNNRLRFTIIISCFCLLICNFMLWACGEGLMGAGTVAFVGAVCMIVIGYNIGVCVCHNKGWRGA